MYGGTYGNEVTDPIKKIEILNEGVIVFRTEIQLECEMLDVIVVEYHFKKYIIFRGDFYYDGISIYELTLPIPQQDREFTEEEMDQIRDRGWICPKR